MANFGDLNFLFFLGTELVTTYTYTHTLTPNSNKDKNKKACKCRVLTRGVMIGRVLFFFFFFDGVGFYSI